MHTCTCAYLHSHIVSTTQYSANYMQEHIAFALINCCCCCIIHIVSLLISCVLHTIQCAFVACTCILFLKMLHLYYNSETTIIVVCFGIPRTISKLSIPRLRQLGCLIFSPHILATFSSECVFDGFEKQIEQQ